MPEPPDERDLELGPIPIDAVPGLARIAVGAWARGAVWGVGTTVRATRRVTEAALSGESATELIDGIRDEAVESLRQLLGVVEKAPRSEPITGAGRPVVPGPAPKERKRAQSLRDRGGALLDRSATVVEAEEPIHPGFDRIVDQLAPDEARILKLLINEGGQPIVYVNKAGPFGIGAREVARRLSIIGREAGCLRPELVPAYLDNLVRLGLVAIRRDPVGDEQAYQVVEAQPDVVEAIKSVGGPFFRGRSSRHSVHISEFGRAFCQLAFPPEHLTGEFDAIELTEDTEIPEPEMDEDGNIRVDAG
ncbi:MAG TPA: Abi-alpha family protein [Solirubrobacterales bacterium]|nr:Abi-alpha family protein [Solirubrobacterales bacterium]